MTDFSTKCGLLECTVHRFGPADAPGEFMHVMNHLLVSNPELCTFIAVFLCDSSIYGWMRAVPLEHMRIVLHIVQHTGWKLKRTKFKWFHNEIEFCSFQNNWEEVHTLDSTMHAVTKWPLHGNPKEVCAFHIPNCKDHNNILHYSQISLRLSWMCNVSKKIDIGSHHGEPQRKDIGTVPFVRNGDATVAIIMLTNAICMAPVQVISEKQVKYVLQSDTTKCKVGAVLLQKRQDGKSRVIAFWGRKRKSAETQYPAYDRNLPALHDAVVNWHYYLHPDRYFTIHTHHASLKHILIQPWLTAQQLEH